MPQYQKSEWKIFRDGVIEIDGYKCKDCGRTRDEAILQVHHKRYVPGRKPWEYPLEECETLCKGCHSARHGITKPQIGWEFLGQEDLGDLTGTCDNCRASIRHSFLIQHESWGAIEVGTFCCDKLTDTRIASNLIESETSYKSRKQRFINSKRWKFENSVYSIKQGGFFIELHQNDSSFLIKIHGLKGKTMYDTLQEAKSKAFDVIASGEFHEYLSKHNIPFTDLKKRKSKKDGKTTANNVWQNEG